MVQKSGGREMGVGCKSEDLTVLRFANLKLLPKEIPLEETYETSY